jgi:GT2 family glycosyltransferase/MoaA/NifB/PqqE/SkfB family radical SAM enzyme/glycosyltransferase involved in cell wall biosynthesis
MNKLIICKEEHTEDVKTLVEEKLMGCSALGNIVLLLDESSSGNDIEQINSFACNRNIEIIQYDSSGPDSIINKLLYEKLSDSHIYWLKGNNKLFHRISSINKFLILKDEALDTYIINEDVEYQKTLLPKFIGITLTNKCNYKCFFCNRESNDKYGTINLEHFYSLKPLIQNAQILNLTGWGEPFSYKNIKEVLKFINENNSNSCISLTSNGSLLTAEIAELLSKNLHQIIISINAASKDIYERDMKNGNWEKVFENIRIARKFIPREKIHFVFVGHRDNIFEFPQFVKLAAELDVWQVELLHLQVTKLEDIKKSLWFHKEITNKYIDEAVELGKKLNIDVLARKFDNDYESKINKFDCTAPLDQAYISESGNVAPCCYSGTQNMGNVNFHDGFDNIWNNKKYNRLRTEKYFPECQTCGNANSLNNLMTHINVLLVKDPKVYEQLPLVSVVVPSYNQAEWLPKTLDSIIAQSYPVWEAVVVDDGSTDNTWEVIQEYSKKDSRIKGIHKDNGGISSALNTGIENATGKFFCWLSSDDLFNPAKLELQVKAFEQLNNSYGIIFGAFDLIDANDKVTKLTQSKPFFDGMEFPQQLKYDMIDGCTVMLPMSVMREMGGFNTQYKHAQDTEFWFRLAAKGYKFHYISEKLTKRRIHEQQGFTDFNLDCRYDGYYFVNYYLTNYSFRDLYKNLNFNSNDDLDKFVRHFFDMISDPNCHINHPLVNDTFLTWFEIGLKTIEVKKRKAILSTLLELFNSKKDGDSFSKSYMIFLKRLLERIGNLKPISYRLNENFADITKYDRSKDDTFAQRLFKFSYQELADKRYDIALSVFKYLSDFQNVHYNESIEKFYELVLQENEHLKFIKSFRRKEHISTFPDRIKFFYWYSKYSLSKNDNELDSIESMINDNDFKIIIEKIKSGSSKSISQDQISFWNYKVIPYEVQHRIEFNCPNCGEKINRKITSQLNNGPIEERILCKSCFTEFLFEEKSIIDYFLNRIKQENKVSPIVNRKPKIAFIMRYTNIIGGGVKVAYRYMQRLVDLGCSVTVYTDTDEPDWIKLPVKFIRVNDHYKIEKIDTDVVVVFSIYDVPKILMKFNPEKVFHLCQGYEGYHIGKTYQELRSDKFFYTALHSLPVKNILVSNHLMQMFEDKWNRKGFYIPNGIDLKTFKPIEGIIKRKNSILFVGNPHDELKGFNFLLQSLAMLQSSIYKFDELNVYVVWGGAKLNGEDLVKEAKNLRINYISGLTSDGIAKLINEVSLLVSTSWYEGFTLPVLEAMACGTPTIVTNNMGAESFCEHNVNSFLVKQGDHNALMNQIIEILRNRIDLTHIIKNGYDTAIQYSEYNSLKAFIENWQKILELNFNVEKVDKLLERHKYNESELLQSFSEILTLREKALNKSNSPIVSVIVPIYNQVKYTLEFLSSIILKTSLDFEIILIDNASSDNSANLIQEKYPQVIIIRNENNYGFPQAINQGIQVSRGRYILIANNDIVLTQNWLERLIEIAETDSKIGLVGPISNEVSGVQRDKEAKYNTIDEMHLYAATVRSKNKNKITHFPRVAFLCTLIKREVINKIGGLDERFSPGNFEDDDFCLRAQLAGFKTVIANDVFIHHYGSKSFKADGEKKYIDRLKTNLKIFVDKWNADPDEIWLKGKPFNQKRSLFISVKKDEFIKCFERAHKNIEDKEYGLALNSLELALCEFDKSDAAISIIQKIDLLMLTANVSLIINDLENSKNYFEETLKLNPSSSDACFGLGQVFYQAEMFEQSKTMFEWAVKNNSRNQKAIDALKLVNQNLSLPENHNSLFENEMIPIESES